MCSNWTSSWRTEREFKLYIAWVPLALIREGGGCLLILCGFISTILDNVPEALPRQGCHLNKTQLLTVTELWTIPVLISVWVITQVWDHSNGNLKRVMRKQWVSSKMCRRYKLLHLISLFQEARVNLMSYVIWNVPWSKSEDMNVTAQ